MFPLPNWKIRDLPRECWGGILSALPSWYIWDLSRWCWRGLLLFPLSSREVWNLSRQYWRDILLYFLPSQHVFWCSGCQHPLHMCPLPIQRHLPCREHKSDCMCVTNNNPWTRSITAHRSTHTNSSWNQCRSVCHQLGGGLLPIQQIPWNIQYPQGRSQSRVAGSQDCEIRSSWMGLSAGSQQGEQG